MHSDFDVQVKFTIFWLNSIKGTFLICMCWISQKVHQSTCLISKEIEDMGLGASQQCFIFAKQLLLLENLALPIQNIPSHLY